MRPLLQRHHRPCKLAALALLCMFGLLPGAGAASVQLPVDLLQPDSAWSAPAAGALERALTIDTNTSQHNLELLLDARRAGEAANPQRGGQPAARPTLPTAQPGGTLIPLGLQTQDSVTAPGAAERREWSGTAGTARPGLPGGASTYGNPQDTGFARTAGHAAGDIDPGRIRQLLGEASQFVRDNRFWLLGGAGLLALAVAGLQALGRRG